MITLTKNGNAIVFTFEDNAHYLFDGTIEVPINSLTLITDNSQMATFKKSASNDVFISARYDELGMSKAELESWFKENACGSTGGGGVTSGEVETMIEASLEDYYDIDEVDTALANKADTSAVTASISAAVSGKVNTSAYNTYTAATDSRLAEDEEVTAAGLNALNDRIDAIDITVDDAKAYYINFMTIDSMRDEDWNGIVAAIDDHRPIYAGYLMADGTMRYYCVEYMNKNSGNTEIVTAVSDNESHYFYTFTKNGSNDYSLNYTTKPYVTDAEKATWNAKQNALSAGTGIEISGNVISATGGGGGKAIVAGRGIEVTTGATADTVSFSLPISATTAGTNSIILFGSTNNTTNSDAKSCLINGSNNTVRSYNNIILGSSNNFDTNSTNNLVKGQSNNLQGGNSSNTIVGNSNNLPMYGANGTIILGNENKLTSNGERRILIGKGLSALNTEEIATGKYNVSHSGSTNADKTAFSIGNGTSSAATHNAFEIRQNGDIYVNDGTNDVRLQDTILALGGLKFVKLTQAEYDQLATKDDNTLYIISNVVS